jgi:alkylated DNA nucleotide flippase Atl1
MTMGIFLNILAGATEEALAEKRPAIAPYWRVVDERGNLPPKFPSGRARQAAHLRAEGHQITSAWRVRNVGAALVGR